jgi:hypothetical protein
MVRLARAIAEIHIAQYGQERFLKRLSDPFWFQAFSCVLGFDWHSSGTTTVTCGALKEAMDPAEHGIAVAGGKGRVSRKAPMEIEGWGEYFNISTSNVKELVRTSRLTAKVDSAAVQDGYQLYHHIFLMTEKGKWAVVQQGLDANADYARRYHWCSGDFRSFVVEPHSAILGDQNHEQVLDMTSRTSESSRKLSVDLVKEPTGKLQNTVTELTPLARFDSTVQCRLDAWGDKKSDPLEPTRVETLHMPVHINWPLMREVYEFQPKNYEELLGIKGVGPATVRALALIGELIYGEKPSWRDPVKFSFTVGGKDGVPFPVDRKAMDESVEILKAGVEEARVEKREKLDALNRLRKFVPEDYEA